MPPSPDDVVDDHPRLAAGDHARHEGQHAVGRPEHVDAEAPPPVVRLLFPRVAAAARRHAGVVPQHVAGAELAEDRVGERLDRRGVRHVGDDAPHVAVSAELVDTRRSSTGASMSATTTRSPRRAAPRRSRDRCPAAPPVTTATFPDRSSMALPPESRPGGPGPPAHRGARRRPPPDGAAPDPSRAVSPRAPGCRGGGGAGVRVRDGRLKDGVVPVEHNWVSDTGARGARQQRRRCRRRRIRRRWVPFRRTATPPRPPGTTAGPPPGSSSPGSWPPRSGSWPRPASTPASPPGRPPPAAPPPGRWT